MQRRQAVPDFGLQLVYISTDYIFKGDRGLYSETDAVYPSNKYAWSKPGGECAMRLYDKALIIRTSFGPNTFPYEKAFVDQWTSRESVSVIARKINALLTRTSRVLYTSAVSGNCPSVRHAVGCHKGHRQDVDP